MSTPDIIGYGFCILLAIIMLAMFAFSLVMLIKAIKRHKLRLQEEATSEGRKKWLLLDLEFHLGSNQVILENYEDHIRELRREKNWHRPDRETDAERIDRLVSWSTQLIDSNTATVRDLRAYLIQEIQRFEASRSQPDIIKYGPLIT